MPSRTPRKIDPVDSVKPLPAFNEEGTTLFKRLRPRIIGITEQRLRARNQGSWMMSAKAWKKFMLDLTAPLKKKGS